MSASPITKLSKLRKHRKGKDDEPASTDSLSEDMGNSTPASQASLADRLAAASAPRRTSEDRRSTSESGRLKRLIPNKIKNRRRSSAVGDGDDDERRHDLLPPGSGLSHSERSSRQNSLTTSSKANSIASSLLSDEDQGDNPSPHHRPSLSTHASHNGYLTHSAPEINAQKSSSIPAIATSLIDVPTIKDINITDHTIPQQQVASDDLVGPPAPEKSWTVGANTIQSDTTVDTQKPLEPIEDRPPRGRAGTIRNETPQAAPSVNSTPSKRTRLHGSIDTGRPPATPPNLHDDPPQTLVTPPTPTLPSSPLKQTPTKKSDLNPAVATTGSAPRFKAKTFSFGNLGAPKQSSALAGPALTPPIEEIKTPGGSISAAPQANNFFSSVFSAAQSAATNFTNPFAQSPGQSQKSRQSPFVKQTDSEAAQSISDKSESNPESKTESRLAVLSTAGSAQPSPMTSTFPNLVPPSPNNDTSTSAAGGDPAVAQAISAAYEKQPPPAPPTFAPSINGRPSSIASQGSAPVDQSPSRVSTTQPESNDIKRSGSIRSRLSDRHNRRKRGSSAGTNTTLGGGAASLTSLAPTPSIASGNGHRPTGFTVASSKRNKDFHQLFRSVPEDDYLIEDYSAALQRDILLHGRFYVSEGHICFSSNILGWVTNLVIAFSEIQLVEKKNTAIVFPNALVIQTAHSRNVFASFVARDATFDLLLGIWKASNPNLRVTTTSIEVDSNAEAQKASKGDSTGSDDDSDDDTDDVYDEDADEDDDLLSVTEHGANGSIAGSDAGDANITTRKVSTFPTGTAQPPMNGTAPKGLENADSVVTGAAVSTDHPGPAGHEPSECTDAASHYDRPLVDTTIAAPLGKIYSLWFGPASGVFMRKWLVDDQKSRELSYEDDKTGLDENHKTFTYSYIKPLNAPVGPRQTKCIVTATVQSFDMSKAISIDCSTQTPDVPSGNIFVTKTRYCLMWGPGNSTRIIATCTIEWSGKSWLKGPIEKGANDGQIQYVKDLVAALKAAVTTKPPVKGQVKGKKGRRKGNQTYDTAGAEDARNAAEASKANAEDWGLLEPIRPIFGPFVSLLKPFFTPQIVIAVLFVLLMQSWFGIPRMGSRSGVGPTGADRLVAYEALWAREESDLWDWLEERTGIDSGVLAAAQPRKQVQKVLAKGMKAKVKEKGMQDKEIREAIRITEEKLEALKDAVGH